MFGLQNEDAQLTRRDCLRLSTGALAVLLNGLHAGEARGQSISWHDLLRELTPRATAVYERRMDEDTYVAQLVQLLRRIDPQLVPTGWHLARHRYFTVSEFVIPPGKGFRFHDHRDYNGVLLVAAGSARFRTFEVVGSERMPAAGTPIELRRTSDRQHAAGELSSLTTEHDNIHDIRAGESGCRLIDFATMLGPDPRSIYLDVDEKPLDPAGTRYAASFTSF